MTSPNDLPRTLGELRASGHRERGVKQEIRENLLTALAVGDEVWPGILGFDDTVLPQVERALIAGTTSSCSANAARARRGCCVR